MFKFFLFLINFFSLSVFARFDERPEYQFFSNTCINLRSETPKYNPFDPSENNDQFLNQLVQTTTHYYSKDDRKKILSRLERESCTSVLKTFHILSIESMENKAMEDFNQYYKDKIPSKEEMIFFSPIDKIKKLRKLMYNNEGYHFNYVDSYIPFIENELNLFSALPETIKNQFKIKFQHGFENNLVPQLNNKRITFIGSGFPLSAIIINILTQAKINLVEIDNRALENSKNFLMICDKYGILKFNDFNFILKEGSAFIKNNKTIQSDILYLAAALSRDVKKSILNVIAKRKLKNLFIVDRYVSGIFTLLYDQHLNIRKIKKYRILSKLYPENTFIDKTQRKIKNYKIITTNKANINSSRILMYQTE